MQVDEMWSYRGKPAIESFWQSGCYFVATDDPDVFLEQETKLLYKLHIGTDGTFNLFEVRED